MSQSPANPYVGPRTFQTSERHLFFGREQEARELLSLVISERLALFYASSGAGKSSLINTSLIPGLQAEGFEVLPVSRVSGISGRRAEVENIFVHNCILSLNQADEIPDRFASIQLADFLDNLTYQGGRFYYSEQEADEIELKPRALIIDQFEEILTTYPEAWPKRADFFKQLNRAMLEDEQLWLILAMREDYVAGLAPYAHFLPGQLRARYYMQRMRREAALTAIKEPARLGGRPFAGGVAEQLVDNLRQVRLQDQDLQGEAQKIHLGEFIEPVQLQVVCYQLWENLSGQPLREITLQDLEELGNVDMALAEFYEQALAEAVQKIDISEIELRNWFEEQLITEAGTRGAVYRGRSQTGNLANEVVDLLVSRFLLRPEVRAGGTWYELVHDRFIEPIKQANQRWRLQQPIIQITHRWLDSSRSESQLLEGPPLREALAGQWQRLGPLVREFLETSQRAQEAKEAAQEAEREIQRRRELEIAQKLGDEQRRRAELLRRALLIGGALLILALAGAGFAFIQRRAALTAANVALTAQAVSENAQQTAEAERSVALAAKETAEFQATLAAEARADLAANLEGLIQAGETDPTPTPAATLTPTPMGTPSPEAGLTGTLTMTPTPTSNQPATATGIALQTVQAQLDRVRATQTAAARPIRPPSPPPGSPGGVPLGRIVFASNRDGQLGRQGDLYSMRSDGQDVRRLTSASGGEPTYSSAKQMLVFSRYVASQSPEITLYAMNPNERTERSLDRRFWDNWEPALSVDGLLLAFVSSRQNQGWEIYLMGSDGADDLEDALPLACEDLPTELDKWAPDWSLDGRIAFVLQPDAKADGEFEGQADIWMADPVGQTCIQLTQDGLSKGIMNKRPAWSPDGRQIAYVSNRAGNFEIYIVDVNSRTERKLPATSQANYPDWSPKGDWLVFSTVEMGDIIITALGSQDQHNLTGGPDENWDPIWIE